MFLPSYKIDNNSFVSDIVAHDYRTADVFRSHGIEYCCGGKWPLELVCKMKGLDPGLIQEELEQSIRNVSISNTLDFQKWDIDFLVDYIINIHHQYLRQAIPPLQDHLGRFAGSHRTKFVYLTEVEQLINQLVKHLIPHLQLEEEILFPYIKQIGHAYENKESYAGLFVRTLRKPVESVMHREQEVTAKGLHRLRELTHDYSPPANACTSHKVTFLKLKEFDNDLVQHMYLENDILFPRAIEMEKKLLQKKIDPSL